MKVRYTRRALAEREAIFEYLNQYDPRAARKVKTFIKEKINSLTYSPRRARIVKDLGLHALWLGRYPYIVYYRVDGNVVSIIHIRHAARRPWAAAKIECVRFAPSVCLGSSRVARCEQGPST